jgi:KaiC/GvpD/RAD55 family RecA-like ATPase
MGLLDKVKKKDDTTKGVKESASSKKTDTPVSEESPVVTPHFEKVDASSMAKHIEDSFKKTETKGVKEPVVVQHGNKIGLMRPKGSLKKLKETKGSAKVSKGKPGGIDFAAIKASIGAELKKTETSAEVSAENRTPTGIPGLDGVMQGGFKRKSVSLIVGGPGSGKSTFCMQFLMSGIDDFDEPALYISFEQTEEEIIQDFKRLWDVKQKIKDKKLAILSYTPEQVENILEAGGGSVRDLIESMGAKRIVLDSLTSFSFLEETQLAKRKATHDLFKAIKKWKCTALMIAEQEPDPEKRTPTVEEFEVDGVILLYNMRRGDVRERALEIFKMRDTKHSAKLFPLVIAEKGLVIYPDQTVF